jgi:hypothetical protein
MWWYLAGTAVVAVAAFCFFVVRAILKAVAEVGPVG